MTPALLIGGVTALLAALAAWAWHRLPTRRRCPRCDGPTARVAAPRVLAVGEGLAGRRWCMRCGWEGLGREGPEWTPGKPAAHDSGFRWGEERLPRDFGFHWAGGGGRADPGPERRDRTSEAHVPDEVGSAPSTGRGDDRATRLRPGRGGFRWRIPAAGPRWPGRWRFRWKDGRGEAGPGG